MWLDVKGARLQIGATRTMIFDADYIVWYVSQLMVLEPGDLINTGTPPGVGLDMTPLRYLAPGDVMELGVTGLNSQRQRLVPPHRHRAPALNAR
jgi:2,4-diketo-3-deoxy-L-fuconate hydrolase